jgi:ferredoxin
MKIEVDRELCEANGLCVTICAEVFTLGDDDVLVADEAALPEALRAALEHAVRACPRGALALVD